LNPAWGLSETTYSISCCGLESCPSLSWDSLVWLDKNCGIRPVTKSSQTQNSRKLSATPFGAGHTEYQPEIFCCETSWGTNSCVATSPRCSLINTVISIVGLVNVARFLTLISGPQTPGPSNSGWAAITSNSPHELCKMVE